MPADVRLKVILDAFSNQLISFFFSIKTVESESLQSQGLAMLCKPAYAREEPQKERHTMTREISKWVYASARGLLLQEDPNRMARRMGCDAVT